MCRCNFGRLEHSFTGKRQKNGKKTIERAFAKRHYNEFYRFSF